MMKHNIENRILLLGGGVVGNGAEDPTQVPQQGRQAFYH
jgi:hypothetical protein